MKLDQLTPQIPPPVNPQDREELAPQVRLAVIQGEKYIVAGEYTEARKQLEQAAEAAPHSPEVLRTLGLLHAALRDTEKAIANLSQAMKLAPDDLEAQLLLGVLLEEQGKKQQGIVALRTALKCSEGKADNPLTGEVLLELSRLLQEEGFLTAAAQCLEILSDRIDLHGRSYIPSPKLKDFVLRPERLLARQGALLLSLGKEERAVKVLRQAYRRDRTNRQTARDLMKGLLAKKDYPGAEELLTDMAGERAQLPQVPELSELLCLESGDKETPSRIWKSYVKKHPINTSLGVALSKIARKIGAPDQGSRMLRSLLKEMPGNVEAATFLATLHAEQGQIPQALRSLAELVGANDTAALAVRQTIQEAIVGKVEAGFEDTFAELARTDTSPIKHALHYIAAVLAEFRDDKVTAEEQYGLAIETDKYFLPAYEAMVDLHLLQKRYEDANRLAKQVGASGISGYFSDYLLGKILLARGNVAAVKVLRKAWEGNNRHVPTLLLLGGAQELTGDPRSAIGTLLTALKLAPDETEVYRRLFRLYCRRRFYGMARALAARLLTRHPDALPGQLMLAEVELLTGKHERGLAHIAELQNKHPNNTEVGLLAVRAELMIHRGLIPQEKLDRAVGQLTRIITQNPWNPNALRLLTEVLDRPGKIAQAVKVWGEIHKQTPGRSNIAKIYAAMLGKAKQYNEGANILEHIFAQNPKDQQTRRVLLSFYGKAKSYEKAHKLLDEWMGTDLPRKLRRDLRIQKLGLYRMEKQYDKAVGYARGWVRDAPDDTLPKDFLMTVLAEAKQFDKAHSLLDEWIETQSGERLTQLRQNKILLYVKGNDFDRAEQYVARWIEESPQTLGPRVTLIAALSGNEHYEKALKVVDGWLQHLTPTTAPTTQPGEAVKLTTWLRITAVRLLAEQFKFEEALRRAESYPPKERDNPELLGLMGTCLQELERDAEAIAILEKAFALAPDDKLLNNNLGYTYADSGLHLRKAELMIRKALRGAEDEINFWDSLGWVLYKQGRFPEALRAFRLILQHEDEATAQHPVVFDHAGDVYYRLGAHQESMELWKRALKLAEEQKYKTVEIRRVLSRTAGKVNAVKSGNPPELSPVSKTQSETKEK